MNSPAQKDLHEECLESLEEKEYVFVVVVVLIIFPNTGLAQEKSMKKEMLNVWIAGSLFLTEVKRSCIIISTSILTTCRVKNEMLSRMTRINSRLPLSMKGR